MYLTVRPEAYNKYITKDLENSLIDLTDSNEDKAREVFVLRRLLGVVKQINTESDIEHYSEAAKILELIEELYSLQGVVEAIADINERG